MQHRSKMKLGTALLLFLSLFYLNLANVNAEDDSKQDLTSDNHVGANQIADANNQAEHQLAKRDAGRGRKASCEGTRWVLGLSILLIALFQMW